MYVDGVGFGSSRRRHLGNYRRVGNGCARRRKGGGRAGGDGGGPVFIRPVGGVVVTSKNGDAALALGKPDLAVGPRFRPGNRGIAVMKNGYGRIGFIIAGRVSPDVNFIAPIYAINGTVPAITGRGDAKTKVGCRDIRDMNAVSRINGAGNIGHGSGRFGAGPVCSGIIGIVQPDVVAGINIKGHKIPLGVLE